MQLPASRKSINAVKETDSRSLSLGRCESTRPFQRQCDCGTSSKAKGVQVGERRRRQDAATDGSLTVFRAQAHRRTDTGAGFARAFFVHAITAMERAHFF